MLAILYRFVRLLAVVLWVGGIAFFAFILAPVAFHVLPSLHEAGTVVGAALRVLDLAGIVCGGLFWIATVALGHLTSRRYSGQLGLVFAMMLATWYLHGVVLPAMDRDRASAGGDIEAAPATQPARIHFEALHKRSEQVEGSVLLCGLAVVALMAREPLSANR